MCGPDRRDTQYFRQVHDRMARNREGKLRLPFRRALAVGDEQRGHVQDSGERGEPGLIVMLRTKIAEHGIGKVAFHELRGPGFPIAQVRSQDLAVRKFRVPAKQFRGRGGRSRAGVEKGNVQLPLRKRAVERWQIRDHESQKSETRSALNHRDGLRQGGSRRGAWP